MHADGAERIDLEEPAADAWPQRGEAHGPVQAARRGHTLSYL
jgi:hypothetical protein